MTNVPAFEPADFEALKEDQSGNNGDRSKTKNKLTAWHRAIYPQLRTQNIDLHIMFEEQGVVTDHSATSIHKGDALAIQYTRSRSQARVVERLMGREEAAAVGDVSTRRHPMIELRIAPEALAIELVVAPEARWDQANLAGKLSIDRHSQALYSLLRSMGSNFAMGFWRGVHRNELHLTTAQFYHPQIMDEWMSTFEPGQDWFRLGVWYEPEDDALAHTEFANTILGHIRALYGVYKHILWASDNNFHDFYKR
ncbi:hypothetical protein G4Y79_08195 [Phototrophicus methaneseepsis]|uniref:Uncharacterized protein n=1 Tax=Phototrophicus methaneseepsis TaxID=2710758 RepID=A0A7S8IG65_9CHLR|nr:hypothetical protein [Phototrophicus methaneseepsis]QPC84342.1 hypothetical protein G4Y79_08195 [Phototrophicus methaneseepsis]